MLDPFSNTADSIAGRITHVVASMRSLFAFARCGQRTLSTEDCSNSFIENPSFDTVEVIKVNGVNAIQATSLVFLHSAVESALIDFAKHLLHWDSSLAHEKIKSRTVSFDAYITKQPGDIKRELLDKYLEDFDKFPLPKKVDTLLSFLKSPALKDVIPGFNYNRDTLVEIDEERHRVVHSPSFAKPIEHIDRKLHFLINVLKMLIEVSKKQYAGTIPN